MCCHSVFNRYPMFGGYPAMSMSFNGLYMGAMVPMYNNCCFGGNYMGNSLAVGAGIGLGLGVANIVGGLINKLC